MAARRSVVASIRAGRRLNSTSRRQSCATMSRFRALMSVIANVVCASSGTDKMSRMSRRVKPIEPAPIIAILMGLLISGCIVAGGRDVADLPDFDKLWDYNDPAATEQKF